MESERVELAVKQLEDAAMEAGRAAINWRYSLNGRKQGINKFEWRLIRALEALAKANMDFELTREN